MGCCFSEPVVEPIPVAPAYAVRCEPIYQVPQGYGQQIIIQTQSQPYDPYHPQTLVYQQPQGQALTYQQPMPYYPYQPPQSQGNI